MYIVLPISYHLSDNQIERDLLCWVMCWLSSVIRSCLGSTISVLCLVSACRRCFCRVLCCCEYAHVVRNQTDCLGSCNCVAINRLKPKSKHWFVGNICQWVNKRPNTIYHGELTFFFMFFSEYNWRSATFIIWSCYWYTFRDLSRYFFFGEIPVVYYFSAKTAGFCIKIGVIFPFYYFPTKRCIFFNLFMLHFIYFYDNRKKNNISWSFRHEVVCVPCYGYSSLPKP